MDQHAPCQAEKAPSVTPRNRLRATLGPLAGFSALALLSACASHTSSLPPTQQAAYYAAHSPGDYTPPGPPSDPWGPYIQQASTRFDVPTRWIRQVMRVESGGNEYMHGHLTVSYAGAMGLMQLEPETYREMAARYGLGPDPFNPYNNIMAGTAYIHEMYEIYGSPGFLAAYNAGPGRLDDYLDYKQPLPNQTRQYVAMIAPRIEGVYPSGQSGVTAVAMNRLPAHIGPGLRSGADATSADQLNQTQLAAYSPPATQTPVPTPQPAPAPQPAPIQMAALTPPPTIERPRYTPPIARTMPPVHHGGFSLIPSAEAATPMPAPMPEAAPAPAIQAASYNPSPHYLPGAPHPAARAASPSASSASPGTARMGNGHWGVQVGAYDTSAHAKAALGIAELSAVAMLIKGQAVVQHVSTSHGQFYRARFVDLPHEQALAACQRLNRAPTGCEVLSPDAQ